MTRRAPRTRTRAASCLTALALALFALAQAPAAQADSGPAEPVIVRGTSVEAAAHAVDAAGGTVDLELPIVAGVGAHVDGTTLAILEHDSSVQVAPDLTLHTTSASFDAANASNQVAAVDPGPAWSGNAGAGVAVALVDTGVADTPDLNGSRLIRGPDFSGEDDGIDHYGHGTFMAGLIAGDGAAGASDGTHYTGVAPGATIVSVKVADAAGITNLSRVLAGIGWVVEHAEQYGIGVMSLSFSVDSPVPYFANPLSAAVELAWAAGVTVVAAAGNNGAGSVTSPGDDPYVISVGATDTGSTATTADDVVPDWSGNEQFRRYAKPDVVAPGVSVVSLRAPGSFIDRNHPDARVDDAYFRGTGTSMSTAMVAGAAAVLMARHGDATPDDVKGALVDGAASLADGGRAVDLDAADNATPRPGWWQHYQIAFGLFFSAGDGMPWTATRWAGNSWAATRWAATRWAATRWAATRWAATRWADVDWAATSWSAQSWG